MERLARDKIANQQKLSAMKKEISARWDHIDFNAILPDMNSLENQKDKETKSTTTASEQPDLDEDMPLQLPQSAPSNTLQFANDAAKFSSGIGSSNNGSVILQYHRTESSNESPVFYRWAY